MSMMMMMMKMSAMAVFGWGRCPGGGICAVASVDGASSRAPACAPGKSARRRLPACGGPHVRIAGPKIDAEFPALRARLDDGQSPRPTYSVSNP